MQKWKYYVSEPISLVGTMGGLKSDAQEHLDAMATRGWELVSVQTNLAGSTSMNAAAYAVYFWRFPDGVLSVSENIVL